MIDRRSRFRVVRRSVAALVVGGLVLAACGTSKDDDSSSATTAKTETSTGSGKGEFQSISGVPGVTDEAISFAALGTGAASDPLGGCNYPCYVEGIRAYFAYRNSLGGVHGRHLELTDVVDDQLGNDQVKALEIMQGGKAFGVFSYPTIASGFPDLAKAGVPLYTVVQFAPEVAGQASSYAVGGSTCISCTSPFYSYAAKQVGAKVVGSLGYGVSPASKQCVKAQDDSIAKYAADSGVTVGYSNDALAFGLPNGIAPEVTAMKKANVDLVLTCLDQRAVGTLEQELQRQGMDDVKVLLPRAIGDPTLLRGTGADLFEGDVAFVLNRPYDDAPAGSAMAAFTTWIGKSTVQDVNLDVAMQGWVNADLAYRGILAAGPQFDRAKVVAATNGIDDYTAGGLVPPTDWSRQHVPPTQADPVTHGPDPQCMVYAQATKGEWKILGDPAKPWVCWPAGKMGDLGSAKATDFK